jgi:flagellar protein FlaG
MKAPALTAPVTPLPASTTPSLAVAAARTVPKAVSVQPAVPDLDKLIDKLREQIGTIGQQIEFSVDDSSGKAVLRVIDSQTNAVLRQIPGEEVLAIARALERTQGLLVQQKA